jgi:transcriptional regulator with XRE-family HTH domain
MLADMLSKWLSRQRCPACGHLMSQSDFARATGLATETVSRVLLGKRGLSPAAAERVARVTGLSIRSLTR